MRNRRIAEISLLALCIIGVVVALAANDVGNVTTLAPSGKTSWKEVPIHEGEYRANALLVEFDLRKIMQSADYIFCGTVINRREFEVEWEDENGERRGPFPSSVLEVKINKEYCGKSPIYGDKILVYYPQSLSTVYEGSFPIQDGVCQKFCV